MLTLHGYGATRSIGFPYEKLNLMSALEVAAQLALWCIQLYQDILYHAHYASKESPQNGTDPTKGS